MSARKRQLNGLFQSTTLLACALLLPLSALPLTARAQAQSVPQSSQSWRVALDQSMTRLGLESIARAHADEVAAQEARARHRFAGPLENDGGLRQDVIGSGRGYYEVKFGITAPLWRRGERALLREQAASQGSVARLARDVIRLEAAGDLRKAWWAYVEARDIATIEGQQAQLANGVVAQVSRLVAGGEMARLDLRQAEIAAANAAQVTSEAQGLAE